MKKTIILIIAVIVVMILGIVIGKNTVKTEPASSNTIENNQTNTEQNTAVNNMENEVNTNAEVNVVEPEEQEEEPKTDLEKAIYIVKEDWGEDSTVYFAQDGQTDKGEYIICVREKTTTKAKAWYTVNVEDETFTRE